MDEFTPARRCRICSAINDGLESFCTGCGASLLDAEAVFESKKAEVPNTEPLYQQVCPNCGHRNCFLESQDKLTECPDCGLSGISDNVSRVPHPGEGDSAGITEQRVDTTPEPIPQRNRALILRGRGAIEDAQITIQEECILGREHTGHELFDEMNERNLFRKYPSVSGRHCQVSQTETGVFTLTDISSTNCTWMNGLRLNAGIRYPIRRFDTVQLGNFKFIADIGNETEAIQCR